MTFFFPLGLGFYSTIVVGSGKDVYLNPFYAELWNTYQKSLFSINFVDDFFWIIWIDYESISIFWTKSHFLGLNLDCPWTTAVLRSQEAFENVDTIICPQKQKRSQYLIGLSKVALSDREIRSNYKHVN